MGNVIWIGNEPARQVALRLQESGVLVPKADRLKRLAMTADEIERLRKAGLVGSAKRSTTCRKPSLDTGPDI